MDTFNERITTVSNKLNTYGIPHEVNDCWDGAQIRFPWAIGDVACHSYTIGCKIGRVETYQFPWDDGDVTALTPEEAVDKVVQFYIKEVKRFLFSPIKPFLKKEDLE